MPRAKVDPRFRRRVASACESCKKRKAKCNGIQPCDQCVTRQVQDACRYSRYLRQSQSESSVNGSLDETARVEPSILGDAPSVPSPRQVDVSIANASPSSSESQMLKDSRGRFIYVGESASLSFLETVRSAVYAAVGPCAFTNEPARNPMFESTPKIRFEVAKEPSLDLNTAQSLAHHFFVAVSGILDLFDPPWLLDQLQEWVEHPSQRSRPASAIIYLVLAIGAQGRVQGVMDELLAEQCFAYGRQISMFDLMNDPSLATIQAIMLITYYMIAGCQYNAAFVNLGVAARAAYTLGIHLHETNAAFGGEEGLCRERAWKSLRVCDLFLAASLGRPPATSEATSNIPWAPVNVLRDGERPRVAGQVFSAMFRICNVFERILVEGYGKKAVSLELARSISRQHRQWTEELPRMLMVDGFEQSDADSGASPGSSGLPPRHGYSIVTMAYYYSIVLLCKPFLSLQVSQASNQGPQKTASTSTKASFVAYADACVNAAIKGIDIAYEYVFEPNAPRRQPLVINSVFISALCLGLAYLDPSGRHKWPVDPSLDRALRILTHLGELNTQSASFAAICRQLKEAVAIYVTRRDDTLLQQNDQIARSIFGELRASSRRCHSEDSGSIRESARPPSRSIGADQTMVEPMTPPSFDVNMIHEESMLRTFGLPTGNMASVSQNYDQYDPHLGDACYPRLASTAADPLSLYFMDQDVPLFPLTNGTSPESYLGHQNL